MSGGRIPEDIEQLLRNDIESFEQLEVLLLPCREQTRRWTAAAAATELRIDPSLVADILARLCAANSLVSRTDEAGMYFGYHPDAAPLLERLSRIYQDDRIALMNLMTQQAMHRLRASALRTFSAAFILKKHHG